MSAGQKEQAAGLGQMIAAELEQESVSIRKMLERLPAEKLDWRPHEKSTPLGRVAGHIVEMLMWTSVTLTADELDFATSGFEPKNYLSADELVADFDANLAQAIGLLGETTDEKMAELWSLRNGEKILMTLPRNVVMRSLVMNHIIHHRGQLSVYMRLLDIPVPSIYGPSADENPF